MATKHPETEIILAKLATQPALIESEFRLALEEFRAAVRRLRNAVTQLHDDCSSAEAVESDPALSNRLRTLANSLGGYWHLVRASEESCLKLSGHFRQVDGDIKAVQDNATAYTLLPPPG